MSDVLQANAGASKAIFGDINQVAQQERTRLYGPIPEPVEIQLLRFQIADESKHIIADALEHAARIRERAEIEGYQAGHEKGYSTGLADAAAEIEAERAQYRSEIEQFVTLIDMERRRIWHEAEPQIVAFVLEIAKKIVKEEAQINHDIVLSNVRNALRRVVDSDDIRIRVHSDDLESLRAARNDLLALVDGHRQMEIVEDRRVSQGGCMVESGAGIIDARLDTQFAEIEASIRSVLDNAA